MPRSCRARCAGYDTELDDVRRRITPRTKAVILCSPHNPATTIIRRGPLIALLDALGDDPPLVVLDEAYGDFVDDPDYPDGIALLAPLPAAARAPHVLEDRGAGRPARRLRDRLGRRRIDRLNRVRAPYNVNRLGRRARSPPSRTGSTATRPAQLVLEERAFLSRELARRGFLFPPSQANFLLVKVHDATDARGARAGRDPGPRRRRGRLPRPSPDLDRHCARRTSGCSRSSTPSTDPARRAPACRRATTVGCISNPGRRARNSSLRSTATASSACTTATMLVGPERPKV